MNRLNLIFVFLLAKTIYANAQVFERLNVDFEINNEIIKNPLTGGLNAPQLNEVDLNNDQINDLYIFDRIGNVHLPFLNIGTAQNPAYQFASEFVSNFPPDVGNFVLLRDYNKDGIMDLFGHSGEQSAPTSVKAFKGKIENGAITFDRLYFDTLDYLNYVDLVGVTRTLEIAEPDYPAFDDIDGDGDMDILTFDLAGSHVYFYKNLSQEQGFGNEELIFELADDCWGRFLEDMTSPDLILSDDLTMCAQGLVGGVLDDRNVLHPGSTLLTFDENNDGNLDLILGDIASQNLTVLYDTENSQVSWITDQDGLFPSYDTPVDIPDFPSSFLIDLDGDGLKDFVASPNNKNQTPNVEVIWFYKNTGSNEQPDFELQQRDFLVEGMLDFGAGANPTFADVNADGLLDLVVGNETYFNDNSVDLDSRLHLFENIGTANNPIFELVDDNWLNFKQFSDLGSFGFAPTFGDLDNDGDEDLLVGEKDGFLFYVENNAGAGNPMSFNFPQFGWMDIDAGQYSTPQIVDLNRDGLNDIIVGRHSRQVRYYQNQGSNGAPFFDPDVNNSPNNSELGGMEAESIIPQVFTSTAFGAPTVLDFGDSFKTILSSDNGKIKLYENIEGNLDGEFDLVTETFGKTKEGIRLRQAVADINGDGFLDMIVGNFRGGLSFFVTNITTEGLVSVEEEADQNWISIYPNPSIQVVNVDLNNQFYLNTTYEIVNSLGQELKSGVVENQNFEIEIVDLPVGVYWLKLDFGQEKFAKKILKF